MEKMRAGEDTNNPEGHDIPVSREKAEREERNSLAAAKSCR